MKITIQGLPGEGKTTIALIVAHALMKEGFDVSIVDADIAPVSRAEVQAVELSHLQSQRVRALLDKDTAISVETVQAKK